MQREKEIEGNERKLWKVMQKGSLEDTAESDEKWCREKSLEEIRELWELTLKGRLEKIREKGWKVMQRGKFVGNERKVWKVMVKGRLLQDIEKSDGK